MRYVTMVTMTAACLVLAGCSQQDSGASGGPATEQLTTEAAQPAEAGKAGDAAPVTVTLPKIAYAYKLGYRLDGDAIGKTQRAHLDLCNKLGPARCLMVSMDQQSGEERYGAATLKLRVATADAQHFSDQLTRTVSAAGGRATETNVTAEDVSKQMTDTSARIRQREILVERLTEILRTRQGKVADLVEAERSVATAQEELDQARSWLAELQGRVAYSTFEISYAATAASASPGRAGMQLTDSLTASANTFLIGLRVLLTLAIFMAPWALLALPLWLYVRRRRRLSQAEAPATVQA